MQLQSNVDDDNGVDDNDNVDDDDGVDDNDDKDDDENLSARTTRSWKRAMGMQRRLQPTKIYFVSLFP